MMAWKLAEPAGRPVGSVLLDLSPDKRPALTRAI
jgi:hypothetical protein